MEFVEFVIPVIAAAIYSLAFYLKAWQEGKDPFDGIKFATTLIIGLVIGLLMVGSGIDITQESVMVQLGVYAGATAIVETVLKTLWRQIKG